MTPEEQKLDDVMNQAMEEDSIGGLYIPRTIINSWSLIPTQTLQGESKRIAMRLNSFANLFYFAVQVLQLHKLQLNPDPRKNLHYQMCLSVMKDGLKEVIEIPRDHFKSTIYSQALPIWRSLPFNEKDEDLLNRYVAKGLLNSLYIEWMRRAHRQDIRNLIVSENNTNAIKLGVKISNHYINNDLFRELFPEIIPDTGCTWTKDSLHQKRTKRGSQHGEGTYDLISVGSALQSRHYDGCVIQDDLVGRSALKSDIVMNDTIEYHQLLVGAFDSDTENAGRDNDEIIVGNRWSHKDLNSYVRENETYFNFITHSALGGCCSLHPYGTPIFPEAFNLQKLSRWKQRLGAYLFSCQFLNFPINPEKLKFKKSNLKYFHFERDYDAISNPRGDESKPKQYRIKLRHHVHDGDVEDDIYPRNLKRYMVIDPNHSGNKGRCRHAITVTGVSTNPRRVYVLQAWAKACPINDFVQAIFKIALAWKINEIHIETNGAQTYLKFHLEYFIQVNKHKSDWEGIEHIRFVGVKSPNTAGAKEERIDSIIPMTERGEIWVDSNDCAELMEEIDSYGNKAGLIDLLDTLGYGPQIWKFPDIDDAALEALLATRKARFVRAMAQA